MLLENGVFRFWSKNESYFRRESPKKIARIGLSGAITFDSDELSGSNFWSIRTKIMTLSDALGIGGTHATPKRKIGLCEKITKKVDFGSKSKIEKSICRPEDQPTES